MSSIREFLEKRRTEVSKEMQPLEAVAADLRTKLAAAVTKLKLLAAEAADIERAIQALGRRETTKSTITIKEAVLQLLRDAPDGLTSHELLVALNDRYFEGELVRTSMSPQLARLKNC